MGEWVGGEGEGKEKWASNSFLCKAEDLYKHWLLKCHSGKAMESLSMDISAQDNSEGYSSEIGLLKEICRSPTTSPFVFTLFCFST
jgi:hypothetical protein